MSRAADRTRSIAEKSAATSVSACGAVRFEASSAVAVVGEEPVVAGPQMTGEAEQQRFVTCARYLEERAILLAQRDLAVVEAARHEGQSEVGDGLGQ